MNINIDKKVAGLMVLSLVIGGGIGGAVGFAAGHEEGGRGGYEMMKGQNQGGQYDNQADGETADDNGGAPNSDEQKMMPVGNNQNTGTSTTATSSLKTK